MKKFFTLTLTLIVILALCACGDNSSGDTNVRSDSAIGNINSIDDTNSSTTSSTNDAEETGYVGTWVHEKTDAEPFKMVLTIKRDGTVDYSFQGKSSSEARVWYEDDDFDAKEGAIEIARVGNEGWGDDAYIREDGCLHWELNLNFSTYSFDYIILERQ